MTVVLEHRRTSTGEHPFRVKSCQKCGKKYWGRIIHGHALGHSKKIYCGDCYKKVHGQAPRDWLVQNFTR